MGLRRWWRDGGGPHADPELERRSQQLVGRLDEACGQLEQVLAEINQATGELSMKDVQDKARRQQT